MHPWQKKQLEESAVHLAEMRRRKEVTGRVKKIWRYRAKIVAGGLGLIALGIAGAVLYALR